MAPKLNSIQVLRAYAAISVMIGHATMEAFTNYKVDHNAFNEFPLLAGVDIFFVISGFIMYHTSSQHFGKEGAIRSFLWRRFVRIIPLYWAFTTLMVLTLIVLSSSVRTAQLDWGNVISSYLFVPYTSANGKIIPVLSLGWTLNYEMFFYLIFAATLLLSRKIGTIALLSSLVAFTALGAMLDPEIAPLKFWSDSIILEFGFGVLLSVAMQNNRIHKSMFAAVFFAAIGFALLLFFSNYFPDLPRAIKGGVPATLILLACLAVPERIDSRIPHWLMLIGDSSFALYLCHRFVMRPLTMAMGNIGPQSPELGIALYVVLTTVIAVPISILIYKFFETPTLKILKAGILGRKEMKTA